MKKIIFLLVLCSSGQLLWGQTTAVLNLNSGVHLKSQEGAYLVLNNAHLVNDNGIIQQEGGDGVVKFTGGAAVLITGSAPILIDKLEMAKQAGTVLRLGCNISVGTSLTFAAGLLNLDNFIVDLGSGRLLGESEQSRTYTTGSGFIQATGALNAPVQVDLGNLGAVITSSVDFGTTIIRRGHAVQTGIAGTSQSIKRYFDIIASPKINIIKFLPSIKTTLRFRYFDAELNGLNEKNLYQWRAMDLITWEFMGASSRDDVANYVERNNIQKLARVTLAEATAPTISCPQNFTVSANLPKCMASVSLTGSNAATATGIPSPTIEYSVNGSPISTTYTFPKGTTKVMALASNGVLPNASCTFTVTVVCGPVTSASPTASPSKEANYEARTQGLKLYPNPATHFLNVEWTTNTTSKSIIRILNAEGKTVKTIATASNVFKQRISLEGFAKGIYMLVLTNDLDRQVSKFVIQ